MTHPSQPKPFVLCAKYGIYLLRQSGARREMCVRSPQVHNYVLSYFLIEVVSMKDLFSTPSGRLGNSELVPPKTITSTRVFTENTVLQKQK